MPYQAGNRLPGERSSRIAHLDVLKSPLVKKLVESFNKPDIDEINLDPGWLPLPEEAEPLKFIFGVDGSNQTVTSDASPYSSIAFVKTAIMKMDRYALAKIDKDNPHPLMLRDIISDSVAYHATALPLRNVWIPGMSNYHAVRNIIYESVKDESEQMEGEILETLRWLAYEKWQPEKRELYPFECPYCHQNIATLDYNEVEGECPGCHGQIFLTDMLGFHLDMGDDSAPEGVASTYRDVHETLLLFTAVRNYWENKRQHISDCLFVKDGPLSIRAQYSKLVKPIRNFITYAQSSGYPVHMIGQEKSGLFFDHLNFIAKEAPVKSFFIPQDDYIKTQIQQRSLQGASYGFDTNYGAKIFIKTNDYHKMVLNIPIGEYNPNPSMEDLIGFERIIGTLPHILSNRFEGALLPVELAHGVVSLSTYPSAKILSLFVESKT